MEINRRHFIALLVGGAAGIQATPLPWKLTDDIAIWTQNWPWVPVPPMGEFTHAKTVCTLCPGGCGIEVRKVDHRAVKIEGRTDYPVNPGGICPLGGVLGNSLKLPGTRPWVRWPVGFLICASKENLKPSQPWMEIPCYPPWPQ
jgi:hypothetical protein